MRASNHPRGVGGIGGIRFENTSSYFGLNKCTSGLKSLVHARKTEAYGFIEFEISSSTSSTVFRQPVNPASCELTGRKPEAGCWSANQVSRERSQTCTEIGSAKSTCEPLERAALRAPSTAQREDAIATPAERGVPGQRDMRMTASVVASHRASAHVVANTR